MSNPNPSPENRFKVGEIHNPKGRPKGKTMKEFAREFLMMKSDEAKKKWLKGLDSGLVWRMAEGNPENKTNVTIKGKPISDSLLSDVSKDDSITKNKKPD